MDTPTDRKYTREHEWLQRTGNGTARMGLTAFAARELGDVVFVELPQPGFRGEAGEAAGTVESVKAVAEFFLPVSGQVEVVNDALHDEPERLNDDPYGEGWLLDLALDDAGSLDGLLSAAEYDDFCAQEQ